MDKKTAKRDPFFDALKAIAIFLVVMQHCYIYCANGRFEDNWVSQAVSLIDVPTFMFVCGYFTFSSSLSANKLLHRVKGLLLPFIFWSLFYYFCFTKTFGYPPIKEFIIGLFRAPYFCSPLWFFRTLAILTVIAYGCKKLNRFGHYDIIALIASYLLILGVAVFITKDYAIQSLSAQMGFFILGYAVCKYQIFQKKISFKTINLLGVSFVACLALKVNGLMGGGGNPFIFKLCNYTGIAFAVVVVNAVRNSKIINSKAVLFVGRHTLEIYSTHFLWVYLFMIIGLPVVDGVSFLFMTLYTMCAIALSIITASVVAKVKFLNLIVYGK